MKKHLSLAVALCTATLATANDSLDSFLSDTTTNLKVRSILIQMNPNDVDFSDKTYDLGTAAGIVADLNPTLAGQLVGGANQIPGYAGGTDPTNPAHVAAAIQTLEAASQTSLAAITAGINASLKEEVEKEGTLDQAGSALWVQIESPYLFDVIGFDLGFQTAIKHMKNDKSRNLIITNEDDETYARLSSARLKTKFGSDELYVKANAGYYSDGDETDYLLDEADLGYGVSGHYKDFSLSFQSVIEHASTTSDEFVEIDPTEDTFELSYKSDIGEAIISREIFADVMNTDKISVASGLPLAWLGLPVDADKERDYLLVGKASYGTRSFETDGLDDANQYEITLGFRLDGLTLAGSYNKASEEGGADINDLTDRALINTFEKPNQATMTYVAAFDGAMVGLDGLILKGVHLSSDDIDMEKTDPIYQLTGEKSFTETLIDASYELQDGLFKGLAFRTVFGNETNIANISGYGLFLDYNYQF